MVIKSVGKEILYLINPNNQISIDIRITKFFFLYLYRCSDITSLFILNFYLVIG